MVDEGGSLGNGPRCNKKRQERAKDDGGEGGRSIIAETGNILTGARMRGLNKIPWIIVSRSARTGAINSLAWFQCLSVSLLGPYWVHSAPLPPSRASFFPPVFFIAALLFALLYTRAFLRRRGSTYDREPVVFIQLAHTPVYTRLPSSSRSWKSLSSGCSVPMYQTSLPQLRTIVMIKE